MVFEEQHHRSQGTLGIEHAGRRTADRVIQVVLVARQRLPSEIALVVTHDHLLGNRHHGHRRLHTRQVLHAPFQLIDGFHGFVSRAHFRRRGDHHHQHVGTGRVIADDEVVIQVVARIWTQLRRTWIKVTNFHILAVVDTKAEGNHCQYDGYRCHFRMCELGNGQPELLRARRHFTVALDGTFADTDVGHQNRQQHQVGENDHTHTDRGSDTQLANNFNFDQQQGNETHRIGNQRHDTRDIQRPECTAGGRIGVIGVAIFNGHAVDDLHTVGNTDGKHQKGYQDRIGIQTKAHTAQQTQLPDHRDDRTHQGGQRAFQTPSKDHQ